MRAKTDSIGRLLYWTYLGRCELHLKSAAKNVSSALCGISSTWCHWCSCRGVTPTTCSSWGRSCSRSSYGHSSGRGCNDISAFKFCLGQGCPQSIRVRFDLVVASLYHLLHLRILFLLDDELEELYAIPKRFHCFLNFA